MEQNGLPNSEEAICQVETLAERYILLDSLQFKLLLESENEKAVLCSPEDMVYNILEMYHNSLLVSHQGVAKTHVTIKEMFILLI